MSPLPVKESDDAAAADGNANEVQLLRNPSPFIIRTYELVDDSAVDDIISWNDDGSSFILWQPAKFARDLLPKYFKHNNFPSFVRQLNIYGFRNVVPHRWEFANDCFKRGHKQLLCGIQPLASMVTLGDDISSEMDISRVGESLQKGDVGISKDPGTCSSRKSTSAVSSTSNQFLEKAQRDFALRNKKKIEMKKRLRKSTEKFSGDSKDELGELEVEEVTMGDNPIQSPISTDFLADYSIDPCVDSQPLSLVSYSPDFKPALSFDALYYSTLFPPRHEFEKDTLIRLWMANGFVVC
ncbi:heat shock factor protein HSF24 isoform X2 [Beta vulgaris subsp. vulgaris]|uniref:heat shock factor protein HSF24 isoform X2 n=1 Tax=Beta vulgaris subsp. vulgaris TaxID=3555 RepID=UPI002036DCD8|nr:heat shock factor protein HSF24 isoform X2 [Beta vulgaris subsp. vulgaris]